MHLFKDHLQNMSICHNVSFQISQNSKTFQLDFESQINNFDSRFMIKEIHSWFGCKRKMNKNIN